MVSLGSNKDRLRVGAVQPGKGQALGSPYCSLPVTKGGLHESWRARACSDRTRKNGF